MQRIDEVVNETAGLAKGFIGTLFDSINDCISVIETKEFKVVMANRAFLKSHDMDGEEVMGKHCYEISHRRSSPCEGEDDLCPLMQTLRTGCQSSAVHLHYDKKGKKKYIEINTHPILNEKGEIPHVIHSSNDITDRKQTEEALRESEERYQRLIESVTDYIYTVTVEDGQPVSTSHGPGCVAVTGYTSEEYEADPFLWYRMVYEEDRQAVLEQAASAIAGEDRRPIEHRIYHRDGSLRWIRNTPVVRKDGKGQVIAYDGLISDITERKQLEAQFLQAQKMETVGRLAGGVAHDFNNLLTSILGHAELAMIEAPPDSPVYQNLLEVKKSANRASNLTRQLLAFSRRQVIKPEVVNLNDVIANVEKMLRRLIGEDIEMRMSLWPDLGSVKVDPNQFEQILVNLAVNSRDAMPNGGELIIETSNITLDKDYTHKHICVDSGPYVMLAVTDTGCGMDENTREKIFEPFFTTKEVDKGTGLGLSTVYGIVKQHRGYIFVYSEKGQGTTFKIYLPRIEEMPNIQRKESEVRMVLPQGIETILLVEDDDAVRSVISKTLCNKGYKVLEAVNGAEALKLIRRHDGEKIDLLITDIVMPQMNGKDLAAQLKTALPDIKILFISGYSDMVVTRRPLFETNANFIQKPFSLSVLAHKVREILDTAPTSG